MYEAYMGTSPVETALLAGQFFQRNSSRALFEFVGSHHPGTHPWIRIFKRRSIAFVLA
jgi:hypothetical protein